MTSGVSGFFGLTEWEGLPMDVDEEWNEEVDVLVDVLDMGIFNDQWQEQPQIFKPSGEDEDVVVVVEGDWR